MTDALIGHSGFVGGTLLRQRAFDALYRSTDIHEIAGREFDLVVCAGAPAQKWIANRAPVEDRANIEAMIGHLSAMRCKSFVLISTVDVFGDPTGVDETSEVSEQGLHPYGLHRRLLERAVERMFDDHLIVRLPGLVGPGLRKNVVFDLLNDNNLHVVDSRGEFQFYPMVNLWDDLQRARGAGLRCVRSKIEPVSVERVAAEGFGRPFVNHLQAKPARYDFRSVHAELFGGHGAYQYDARASLMAIRAYAQSEPRSAPKAA